MILLDTHIWIWWVDGGPQLPAAHRSLLATGPAGGLGVSAISCWEVAKLVELGRLALGCAVEDWLAAALAPPIRLLPLTPEIAVESTRLPGPFHRDPADQIIVATARWHGLPLLTLDRLILAYPHVTLVP